MSAYIDSKGVQHSMNQINSLCRRWLVRGTAILVLLVTVLVASSAQASIVPLLNGDFETGDFTGWTPTGVNGGFALVVPEGACFSAFDTTEIQLPGTFSAKLRSGAGDPTNSVGILTSDAFTAGEAIRFKALSETIFSLPNPSTFTVNILKASDDSVLSSTVVSPNIADLLQICPDGTGPTGAFSQHSISTAAFRGTSIKVQFQQHTNYGGLGVFTLVDDVEVDIDDIPPTVTCSASPSSLWPPNHKLKTVTAAVSVTDAESGPAGFTLVSVTSSEPDNGLGDGDQANDIQDFVTGTPDLTGLLRAERSGLVGGRVYTLSYSGSDLAGNTATCSATVQVPHDQR
jgi:hypothetical protein